MFSSAGKYPYREVLEGVRLRALARGESTQMVEFSLDAGYTLPLHQHPNEQTGYLVSGQLELCIGEKLFQVHPGDSWSIPAGVMHSAKVLEQSVAIEVFSPVREEYLAEVLHPNSDAK